MRLDTRLSFVKHATSVAAGAKEAAAPFGRLMPNIGGPSQSKRSLLMSVVLSRLLYGAPIWADSVLRVRKSEEALLKAQKTAALRIARCYRTVSDMAALVLAKMPPASLLAKSRKSMGDSKKSGNILSKAELTRDYQTMAIDVGLHLKSLVDQTAYSRFSQMVVSGANPSEFSPGSGTY